MDFANYHPAEDGASTHEKAAPRATRATAGEDQMATSADGGDLTSHQSEQKQNTQHGKARAPVSVPPALEICALEIWEKYHPAELWYMAGAANIQSEIHDLDLDDGFYLIIRFHPRPRPANDQRGYFTQIIPPQED